MIQKKADIKDGARLYMFLHHHRTAHMCVHKTGNRNFYICSPQLLNNNTYSFYSFTGWADCFVLDVSSTGSTGIAPFWVHTYAETSTASL